MTEIFFSKFNLQNISKSFFDFACLQLDIFEKDLTDLHFT